MTRIVPQGGESQAGSCKLAQPHGRHEHGSGRPANARLLNTGAAVAAIPFAQVMVFNIPCQISMSRQAHSWPILVHWPQRVNRQVRGITMANIGYARVSTHSQNEDSQVDELEAAGCEKVYVDKASGKLARRPQLDACLAYLRPGDVLVITRLSRAMRSLRHMIGLAHDLAERNIGLRVLKQDIDTTTPHGRLVFHLMAAIDEFQRELIVEGTQEGLAAARARGRVGGRKPKLTSAQVRKVRDLYDATGPDGKRLLTVEKIATKFGVSRGTIYSALRQSGIGR